MLSDRRPFLSVCLSCLYVTLVLCGQTIERIKIKVGMPIGLGPGHIVLDGDSAPLPQSGTAPNFRPISVVAKWLDGSRSHLVWREASAQATLCQIGTQLLLPTKGTQPLPLIFGPCLLWLNSWMDQDATLYGDSSRPRPHCARWGPSPPPQKGHTTPNFRPMSIVVKRLDGSRCHLVWR